MVIPLKYGKHGLNVNLPDHNVTVIEPQFIAGLPDERSSFIDAVHHPSGTAPLQDLIRPNDTIAIAFCDLTRPVPNDRIIPWLLEELAFHPKEKITLINATGLHRPNTEVELADMLTVDVMQAYRVINHVATDQEQLTHLGQSSSGGEVYINSEYYTADIKILTGLIEPHVMAGFAGGPKVVLPGVAGLETILHNHGARMMGAPTTTWGITTGNPLWEDMHDVANMTNPTFMINVTLNKDKAITGIFAGDLNAAHAEGVEFVRKTVMQKVPEPFDIVVTTNAGYPLDLNLLQSLKGVSAARQIVKHGGSIVAAVECSDGVPDHGNYKTLLNNAGSIQEALHTITTSEITHVEQWIVQMQAAVQQWADVYIYSALPPEEVRRCHLLPIVDVEACVRGLLQKYGPQATLAVLPEGPQTIPYLAE